MNGELFHFQNLKINSELNRNKSEEHCVHKVTKSLNHNSHLKKHGNSILFKKKSSIFAL
jgi:hypothetical protein